LLVVGVVSLSYPISDDPSVNSIIAAPITEKKMQGFRGQEASGLS
jgi:hypothetical protein